MKRTPLKRSKPLKAKTRIKPRSAKKAAYRTSAEGQQAHEEWVAKYPLRANARGKGCTLRLDGCRRDPEYSVLCHIRRNNWGGVGLKPNDILAFIACDVCHHKEETHHPDCTDADILRALGETLMIHLQRGILGVHYGRVDYLA